MAGNVIPFTTKWNPLVVVNVSRRFGILEILLDTPRPWQCFDVWLDDGSAAGLSVRWTARGDHLGTVPVTFLLASCFWWNDDKQGDYEAETRRLVGKLQPAFRFLIGDQVYQDWPARMMDKRPATEIYEERYEQYWTDPGYAKVLSSVPSYFVCDDHEFWNDAPEKQLQLARTYTEASRKEFWEAGANLFDAYQASCNPERKRWYAFDVAPASFFLADTRSERTLVGENPPAFLGPDQWTALEKWVRGLRGPGFLVLGQPFFQKDGDYKDHSLSNFTDDYARLCTLLRSSHLGLNDEKKPHHVVILTGDIHCGRLSQARVQGAPAGFEYLYEFVASPASRINPYLSTPTLEDPPVRTNPRKPGISSDFSPITVLEPSDYRPGGRRYATIHNNLGAISLSSTINGGVRAELTLYCVRAYNHVHFWERKVPKDSFPNPGQELFHYTLNELR